MDVRPDGMATLARHVMPTETGLRKESLAHRSVPGFDRAVVVTIGLVLMLSAVTTSAVMVLTHTTRWIYAVPLALAGAVFAGRLLGERVWPVVGVRFASFVLRQYARYGRKRGARMLVTPFADFMPSRLRQTWESTAFASGLAIILGTTLLLVMHERSSNGLLWWSLGALALCCGLTVLLVPHWAFARLGLRLSEPHRFVVRSVAESYDRIVRVSNGTILLLAVLYGVNMLADRATRVEWVGTVMITLAGILGFAVVVMGTSAVYFKRHEEDVIKRVAAEARRVGFLPVRMGSVDDA